MYTTLIPHESAEIPPYDLILTSFIFFLPLPLPFSLAGRMLIVATLRTAFVSMASYGSGMHIRLFSMQRYGYIIPAFAALLISARILNIIPSLRLPSLLLFSLALLPAAISEELFFRGYLIDRLQNLQLSYPLTIAVSLLFFAGGHAHQGYAGLIFSLIAAEILIMLRQKTRGLLASVLTHWIYNMTILHLYSANF